MELTILAHGDSDGVVSASLALAALKSSYDKVNVYFTHPYGLVEDFKAFAKGDVVIADIAISEDRSREVVDLFNRYEGKITYIDHHPPPKDVSLKELNAKVVRYEDAGSSSEMTFRLFSQLLPLDYDRIALYGAIADYSDLTRWVKRALARWDKRQIYFEAGILFQGLEGSRKMHDFKREVVLHLSEGKRPSQHSELLIRSLMQSIRNEELYRWVKENVKVSGMVSYVVDPPGSVGIAATYAKGLKGTPIGLAAERRGKIYSISLRGDPSVIDLNEALREIAHELGGSGGGHPEAAGARVPVKKLDDLIYLLNKAV